MKMLPIFLASILCIGAWIAGAAESPEPEGFSRAEHKKDAKVWELVPKRAVLNKIFTNVNADLDKAVRLEISSPDAYVGRLEFITADGRKHQESFLIRNADGFQTYALDMSKNAWWKGMLKQVNLRFSVRDNHAGEPRGTVLLRDPELLRRVNYLPSDPPEELELDTLLPGCTYRLSGAKLLKLSVCDLDGEKRDLSFSGQQEFTLPVDAMKTILTIQSSPAAELFPVKEISLRPASAAQNDWKAPWIWYPEEKVQDNSRRFFRRQIMLPDDVESGWGIVAVDDQFHLSMNGIELGRGNNWGIPQIIDLTGALCRGGTNTIEINAFNDLGGAGVRAEFAFKTKSGKTISLLGGPDWQSSMDGIRWEPAVILPGPVTPYVDVAEEKNLKAGGVTASPGKISLPAGFPSASVCWKDEQPEILVDGKPYLPYTYHFSGGFFHGPLPELPIVDDCVKSGVHLYMITDEYFLAKVWPSEDHFNFAPLDACIRALLGRDPEAKVILTPSLNMPAWWQRKYPGEIIRSFDPAGGRAGKYPSPASGQWRKDGAAYLSALLKHMEQSDYAHSIIAVLPSALQTIEWIYLPIQIRTPSDMSDYSEASLREFRKFIRGKYEDIAVLRKVYRSPEADFDTLPIPSPEKILASEIGAFRDPALCQDVIDYLEFRNLVCAEALLHFCHQVKESSGGKLLSGSYFGYFLEHIPHEALALSGHVMLDKVVKDPAVDILCAPADYLFRMPDLPAGTMSPADTLRLHKKLWIQEDDIRGYLSRKSYFGTDDQYSHGKVDTAIDNAELLRRQYALNRAQGYGFWWYDLNGGWFNNSHLFQFLFGRWMQREKESRHDEKLFAFPREVAWVLDGYSAMYTRKGGFVPLASRAQFKNINRMPLPRDIIQLTDFRDCELPEYKIYIFVNCFSVPEEIRERIHRQLARNNAVAVWLGTSGFFNGKTGRTPECGNIEKTTGFRTLMVATERPLITTISEGEKMVTWNFPLYASPVFVVNDYAARCLSLDGTLAVAAEKDMHGWRSIFFSVNYLPPDALAMLFQWAGVTMYSDDLQDYFYLGRGFAGISIVRSGEKKLVFPAPVEIADYETGRILQKGVREFCFSGKAGTTRLFSIRAADDANVDAKR